MFKKKKARDLKFGVILKDIAKIYTQTEVTIVPVLTKPQSPESLQRTLNWTCWTYRAASHCKS